MTQSLCLVQNLLDRMTNVDKDFRFMATNDLMAELQKEQLKFDHATEVKITHQILSLLKDKNGEVQNLAVKCLGFLISKIKDENIATVIRSLCVMMRHDTEEIRDISSMALKTIVPELPINSKMVETINADLNVNLLNAIANINDVNVQLESLEILNELITRLGSRLDAYHERMQHELIKQLSSNRSAVRKKAMNALSNLLAACSDELFNSTISQLHQALSQLAQKASSDYSQFQMSSSVNTTKTLLQCVATIIRFAGHRSNIDQLNEIIPVICTFCHLDDDELREHSLQAFESYVKRCPISITEALPEIIKICLANIRYDPNYNYASEDPDLVDYDVMDVDEANGVNEDDGDSIDDYSDDDDLSWKVRRASAKCLEAIIIAKKDSVNEFLDTIAPVLVSRFKEREESVKADIIQTFVTLLKQARWNLDNNLIRKIREMIPTIISKSNALWRDKFLKSRQIALAMLTEIVTIVPNGLIDHIPTILQGVLHSLVDKNSNTNMKMDALIFLQELIKAHEPSVFHPHIKNLLEVVLMLVNDSFYRIASEAFSLLTLIVHIARPDGQQPMADYQTVFPAAYERTIDKISLVGIDLEIKERSITCMGQIISTFGDKMSQQLTVALNILYDRLAKDSTRLTTVKALNKIANSRLQIPLSTIFPKAFVNLSSFLKKNSRQLRIHSLILIESLVRKCPELLDSDSTELILGDIPNLIDSNDLHVSQLAFNMLACLIENGKFMNTHFGEQVISKALNLVRCPLLQGSALQSVLVFFTRVVECPPAGLDNTQLLRRLLDPIYAGSNLHKQAYHSTARVVAAISVGSDTRTVQTVQNLINDCAQYKSDDHAFTLILLTFAEIGKVKNLDGAEHLIEFILEAFNSSSEDVKSAASYALGCLAVGNQQKFLPIILAEIEARNKKLYLALHSLREVILSGNLVDQSDIIWTLLMTNCACPEEGIRNVVSECLGKMTLLNATILLNRLIKHFKEDFPQQPLGRSTVIAAIKFTISDQPQEIDDLLRQYIGEFLLGLNDSDIEVRRSALILFNSAAHNKPSLISDLLPSVLPLLYQETKIKPELIRQVEMGPFKHKVDDGLDSRKAAFECMYTLLDTCQNHLNINEFLLHVEDGLRDHYDIKMLTYLMLIKLASICPSHVFQRFDSLMLPIMEVCRSRTKENAVKQEHERQDELKKASLKAFEALRSIPNADGNNSIIRLLDEIRSDKHLSMLHTRIRKDSSIKQVDEPADDLIDN